MKTRVLWALTTTVWLGLAVILPPFKLADCIFALAVALKALADLKGGASEKEKPEKIIEHVHVWNNVPMNLYSPPSMLTVQTCECGAVRDYRGPAYGYVEIKR